MVSHTIHLETQHVMMLRITFIQSRMLTIMVTRYNSYLRQYILSILTIILKIVQQFTSKNDKEILLMLVLSIILKDRFNLFRTVQHHLFHLTFLSMFNELNIFNRMTLR